MSITKQGIITSPNIYESEGTNILLNAEKYYVPETFLSGDGTSLRIGKDLFQHEKYTKSKTLSKGGDLK